MRSQRTAEVVLRQGVAVGLFVVSRRDRLTRLADGLRIG